MARNYTQEEQKDIVHGLNELINDYVKEHDGAVGFAGIIAMNPTMTRKHGTLSALGMAAPMPVLLVIEANLPKLVEAIEDRASQISPLERMAMMMPPPADLFKGLKESGHPLAGILGNILGEDFDDHVHNCPECDENETCELPPAVDYRRQQLGEVDIDDVERNMQAESKKGTPDNGEEMYDEPLWPSKDDLEAGLGDGPEDLDAESGETGP